MFEIDVVTPVAPTHGQIDPLVEDALVLQYRTNIHRYIVCGPERFPGESRAAVIARTRNIAKTYGHAPYLFFLDSDVVIPEDSLFPLAEMLSSDNRLAGIGLCYFDGEDPLVVPAPHVACGATLYRRELLEEITFFGQLRRCECSHALKAFRNKGYDLIYHPTIRATHLRDGH